MVGSNQLTIPGRNVYPFAGGGGTIAARSSSVTPGVGAEMTAPNSQGIVEEDSPIARAGAVAKQGNPMVWWLALVALYFVGGYVTQHFGEKADFANVRLSPFNILTVTLCAILGISMAKFIATKYPIPGLSAVVLAI